MNSQNFIYIYIVNIIIDVQLTCNVLCFAHRIMYRALQFQFEK